MKLIKQVTLSSLIALGIFFAILHSSCTRDACRAVTCLNGSKCSGGVCGPCDSGTGGTNCEIIYRQQYVAPPATSSTYMGNAVISYTATDTAVLDSGYVTHTDDSNSLAFSYNSTDTVYNKMNLVWKDGTKQVLSASIALHNNTSTGSTFTIEPTTIAIPDVISGTGGMFRVSGNGSISTTNASLNITAIAVDSTTPDIYITLSNCPKQ